MSGETILIIEDDPTMQEALKDNFEFAGYTVLTASDGEEGLEKALNLTPELIILDIMLPKINGYEICRLIRKEEIDIPIIMLTAKTEESDIVLGLNLGANDYVTKPFSIKELLARANAFLRNRSKQENQKYHFADFELDLHSKKLFKNQNEIELTPKELSLLSFFVKNPERAVTRDQILKAVWGYDIFITARSVDRCINTLRNKIEDNPRKPKYIKTVREVGYRFEYRQ